jgi:hypothetical protein
MAKMRRVRFLAAMVAGAALLLIGGGVASADLNAPLEPCNSVTAPENLGTASVCASSQDPLNHGTARIGDDGDVQIVVSHAAASATYHAVFASPDGSKTVPLGTLVTDGNGNGRLTAQAGSITALGFRNAGAGNVELIGSGGLQFITGVAVAGSHGPFGPDFNSGLLMCMSVNQPAAISACGSDPLTSGRVQIEGDDGDFQVQVHGAAAHQTYNVFLRAPNGVTLKPGTFSTDKHGNGQLQTTGFLAPTTVASFTVVLQSGGSDQFYSGFNVTQHPRPQTVSQAGLVPCLSVTYPAALTNCGGDPLDSGSADLDGNGKLHVKLTGAEPNETYNIVFRPLNNTGDQALKPTVSTDNNGNASLTAEIFSTPVVGSGSFILQRGGQDEFVPGFSAK